MGREELLPSVIYGIEFQETNYSSSVIPGNWLVTEV